MSRAHSSRRLRALLAVGAVAAVGGALLSATSAQASAESFAVSVTGGYNNSQALGSASGTLTATAGGTSLQYSFTLCGQSTYPNSRVKITAGSGSATHSVYAGSCSVFTGSLASTYAFSTASVVIYGATFYPGNTWTEYSKTRSVAFAGGTTPTPTPTPTPVTNSYNVTVTGASQSLGNATGSLTATRGGTTATYAVYLCGQSTYPSSSVTIKAGTGTATHTVSYQNCQSFSGTLTSSSGISTGTVTVSGSTFYPGNTYTTFTKSKTLYF